MKKLFNLLLLCVTVFAFTAKAQNNTNCNAAFNFTISGLSVNFTASANTSSNDHHNWNFGDGKISSDVSPVHVYANAGTYVVKHVVYRSNSAGTAECTNTVEKRIEIQALTSECNLQAKFSFDRDISQTNKIKFNNLSTPATDIKGVKWSFGDGTYSTEFNPHHIYTTSGLFNVCLIVENNNGCKRDVCMQLQVQAPPPPAICNLTAKFTWQASSDNRHKIKFQNTSINFEPNDQIQWTFGDGTSSSDVNPTHTFSAPGTYNVCIRIKKANSNCVREFCKQITITKEPEVNCNETSIFTLVRSTANCLEFKFTPTVQNPNWKYIWSFGDGTGSTDVSPSHIYPRSGNYTVFLTVVKGTDCFSTSHKIAETSACLSCHNIWAKFEFRREASVSNKFYFHALSSAPIQSQSWTITKLTLAGSAPVILNQNNPSYSFEPGEYRVCLKITTAGNCVKEYCQVISIPRPNSECHLSAFPNPAHNQVTVSVELQQPVMMHLYIYNSVNNLLRHKEQQGITGNNNITVNIENLLPGWYTIKVISGNKICYSRFQKT